jgi:hypothetical protein
MLSLALFYVPSVAFRRAARAELRASLATGAAERVWSRTAALHPSVRVRKTGVSPGVKHLLRYGAWDVALYRALLEASVPKDRAGPIIERVNWAIFGPVTRALFRASRARSAALTTRVRWTLDAMFLTLFTAPFQRRVLPSREDVAFEVTACPLAEFGRDEGVPELIRYAACNMDVLMARDWGVELERAGTACEGAPLCDFRFHLPAPAPVEPRATAPVA